jgi:tellurite resistance protein
VFAFTTLAAGLTVVASWVIGRLSLRSYHPGFYLPTVGGTMLTLALQDQFVSSACR